MNIFQDTLYYIIRDSNSDFAKKLLEIIREDGYSVANDNERAKEMYREFIKRYPDLAYEFRNSHGLTTEYPFSGTEWEIDGKVIRVKDIVHQFLQEQGYNMNNVVKDFIRRIASYDLPQDEYAFYKDMKAYDVIIEDVLMSDDGLFTVKTKTGETYSFYKADKYFSEDTELGKYVKENHGKNNCHDYTENLQKFLPDSVSVTARLAREFDENFYMHSYVELNENQVLDLNFNMVMNKADFESLMKPMKRCFVGKNSEIKQQMEYLDELLKLDEMGDAFLAIKYYDMLKLSAFETLKQRDPELVKLYEEKLAQPS